MIISKINYFNKNKLGGIKRLCTFTLSKQFNMELNFNREFLKGAITGILFCEQQGHYYPQQPFTFNVIKTGNFWEVQFIYTEDIFEIKGGDDGEWLEDTRSNSFKEPINEDANIDDLTKIVQSALEHIYRMEWRA